MHMTNAYNLVGKVENKDFLEEWGVDSRIILKRVLNKVDITMWIELIWLWIHWLFRML